MKPKDVIGLLLLIVLAYLIYLALNPLIEGLDSCPYGQYGCSGSSDSTIGGCCYCPAGKAIHNTSVDGNPPLFLPTGIDLNDDDCSSITCNSIVSGGELVHNWSSFFEPEVSTSSVSNPIIYENQNMKKIVLDEKNLEITENNLNLDEGFDVSVKCKINHTGKTVLDNYVNIKENVVIDKCNQGGGNYKISGLEYFECSPCESGKYSDGIEECRGLGDFANAQPEPCPNGEYKNINTDYNCQPCPNGKYSENTASYLPFLPYDDDARVSRVDDLGGGPGSYTSTNSDIQEGNMIITSGGESGIIHTVNGSNFSISWSLGQSPGTSDSNFIVINNPNSCLLKMKEDEDPLNQADWQNAITRCEEGDLSLDYKESCDDDLTKYGYKWDRGLCRYDSSLGTPPPKPIFDEGGIKRGDRCFEPCLFGKWRTEKGVCEYCLENYEPAKDTGYGVRIEGDGVRTEGIEKYTCNKCGDNQFTQGERWCKTIDSEIDRCKVKGEETDSDCEKLCSREIGCTWATNATCTETATTSVTVDANACAAVTALEDNVECEAVMTDADINVAACTYEAGNDATCIAACKSCGDKELNVNNKTCVSKKDCLPGDDECIYDSDEVCPFGKGYLQKSKRIDGSFCEVCPYGKYSQTNDQKRCKCWEYEDETVAKNTGRIIELDSVTVNNDSIELSFSSGETSNIFEKNIEFFIKKEVREVDRWPLIGSDTGSSAVPLAGQESYANIAKELTESWKGSLAGGSNLSSGVGAVTPSGSTITVTLNGATITQGLRDEDTAFQGARISIDFLAIYLPVEGCIDKTKITCEKGLGVVTTPRLKEGDVNIHADNTNNNEITLDPSIDLKVDDIIVIHTIDSNNEKSDSVISKVTRVKGGNYIIDASLADLVGGNTYQYEIIDSYGKVCSCKEGKYKNSDGNCEVCDSQEFTYEDQYCEKQNTKYECEYINCKWNKIAGPAIQLWSNQAESITKTVYRDDETTGYCSRKNDECNSCEIFLWPRKDPNPYEIEYVDAGGTCSDPTHPTKAACDNANETWTSAKMRQPVQDSDLKEKEYIIRGLLTEEKVNSGDAHEVYLDEADDDEVGAPVLKENNANYAIKCGGREDDLHSQSDSSVLMVNLPLPEGPQPLCDNLEEKSSQETGSSKCTLKTCKKHKNCKFSYKSCIKGEETVDFTVYSADTDQATIIISPEDKGKIKSDEKLWLSHAPYKTCPAIQDDGKNYLPINLTVDSISINNKTVTVHETNPNVMLKQDDIIKFDSDPPDSVCQLNGKKFTVDSIDNYNINLKEDIDSSNSANCKISKFRRFYIEKEEGSSVCVGESGGDCPGVTDFADCLDECSEKIVIKEEEINPNIYQSGTNIDISQINSRDCVIKRENDYGKCIRVDNKTPPNLGTSDTIPHSQPAQEPHYIYDGKVINGYPMTTTDNQNKEICKSQRKYNNEKNNIDMCKIYYEKPIYHDYIATQNDCNDKGYMWVKGLCNDKVSIDEQACMINNSEWTTKMRVDQDNEIEGIFSDDTTGAESMSDGVCLESPCFDITYDRNELHTLINKVGDRDLEDVYNRNSEWIEYTDPLCEGGWHKTFGSCSDGSNSWTGGSRNKCEATSIHKWSQCTDGISTDKETCENNSIYTWYETESRCTDLSINPIPGPSDGGIPLPVRNANSRDTCENIQKHIWIDDATYHNPLLFGNSGNCVEGAGLTGPAAGDTSHAAALAARALARSRGHDTYHNTSKGDCELYKHHWTPTNCQPQYYWRPGYKDLGNPVIAHRASTDDPITITHYRPIPIENIDRNTQTITVNNVPGYGYQGHRTISPGGKIRLENKNDRPSCTETAPLIQAQSVSEDASACDAVSVGDEVACEAVLGSTAAIGISQTWVPASANSIELASADPSIYIGQKLRLVDKPRRTCEVSPKGSDLEVASVSGAVITFTTDLTGDKPNASENCEIIRAIGISQTWLPPFANSIELSRADPSIYIGQKLRLVDKPGRTCEVSPKGSDLVVQAVEADGAVITFTTDLTGGEQSASENCEIIRGSVCTYNVCSLSYDRDLVIDTVETLPPGLEAELAEETAEGLRQRAEEAGLSVSEDEAATSLRRRLYQHLFAGAAIKLVDGSLNQGDSPTKEDCKITHAWEPQWEFPSEGLRHQNTSPTIDITTHNWTQKCKIRKSNVDMLGDLYKDNNHIIGECPSNTEIWPEPSDEVKYGICSDDDRQNSTVCLDSGNHWRCPINCEGQWKTDSTADRRDLHRRAVLDGLLAADPANQKITESQALRGYWNNDPFYPLSADDILSKHDEDSSDISLCTRDNRTNNMVWVDASDGGKAASRASCLAPGGGECAGTSTETTAEECQEKNCEYISGGYCPFNENDWFPIVTDPTIVELPSDLGGNTCFNKICEHGTVNTEATPWDYSSWYSGADGLTDAFLNHVSLPLDSDSVESRINTAWMHAPARIIKNSKDNQDCIECNHGDSYVSVDGTNKYCTDPMDKCNVNFAPKPWPDSGHDGDAPQPNHTCEYPIEWGKWKYMTGRNPRVGDRVLDSNPDGNGRRGSVSARRYTGDSEEVVILWNDDDSSETYTLIPEIVGAEVASINADENKVTLVNDVEESIDVGQLMRLQPQECSFSFTAGDESTCTNTAGCIYTPRVADDCVGTDESGNLPEGWGSGVIDGQTYYYRTSDPGTRQWDPPDAAAEPGGNDCTNGFTPGDESTCRTGCTYIPPVPDACSAPPCIETDFIVDKAPSTNLGSPDYRKITFTNISHQQVTEIDDPNNCLLSRAETIYDSYIMLLYTNDDTDRDTCQQAGGRWRPKCFPCSPQQQNGDDPEEHPGPKNDGECRASGGITIDDVNKAECWNGGHTWISPSQGCCLDNKVPVADDNTACEVCGGGKYKAKDGETSCSTKRDACFNDAGVTGCRNAMKVHSDFGNEENNDWDLYNGALAVKSDDDTIIPINNWVDCSVLENSSEESIFLCDDLQNCMDNVTPECKVCPQGKYSDAINNDNIGPKACKLCYGRGGAGPKPDQERWGAHEDQHPSFLNPGQFKCPIDRQSTLADWSVGNYGENTNDNAEACQCLDCWTYRYNGNNGITSCQLKENTWFNHEYLDVGAGHYTSNPYSFCGRDREQHDPHLEVAKRLDVAPWWNFPPEPSSRSSFRSLHPDWDSDDASTLYWSCTNGWLEDKVDDEEVQTRGSRWGPSWPTCGVTTGVDVDAVRKELGLGWLDRYDVLCGVQER